MNCPSRTDEPPLTDHPTWNQNPPFLSGDLTTCQDLNGIANAREHRDGSGGAAVTDDERGGNGMRRDGWAVADRMPVEAEGRKGLAWGWGSFDGMEFFFFFPSSSFCYRWRTSRLLSELANFTPIKNGGGGAKHLGFLSYVMPKKAVVCSGCGFDGICESMIVRHLEKPRHPFDNN